MVNDICAVLDKKLALLQAMQCSPREAGCRLHMCRLPAGGVERTRVLCEQGQQSPLNGGRSACALLGA